MENIKEKITKSLKLLEEPYLDNNIVDSGVLKSISFEKNILSIDLSSENPWSSLYIKRSA